MAMHEKTHPELFKLDYLVILRKFFEMIDWQQLKDKCFNLYCNHFNY